MMSEPSKEIDEKITFMLDEKMDDVIDVSTSLIEGASKLRPKIDTASDTLKAAEAFLSRAKTLYSVKDYAGTMHSIQQASELMSKSLGSLLMGMDYGDHIKVSHRTPTVFTELVNDQSLSKLVQLAKSVNPKLQTDTAPLEALTRDESKSEEIRNFSFEQINSSLGLCDKIGEELNKVGFDEWFSDLQDKEQTIGITSLVIDFCKLYLIGAITFPHEMTSRYSNKKIKPWSYTEDMGVVRAIPTFLEVLDNCDNDVKQLTKIYSSIQAKIKEIEIGKIPEDWEIKRIGEVCQLVRDQFIPTKEDIRNYVGLEHIEQGTLRLTGVGKSSQVDSNKFVFKKGQVLFGKLRPYFRKVYRPNFDGICSTDIYVIDAKNGYDNGFLFYFFANQDIIDEATNSSEGTRMPRASWNYLSELKRSFPLLPEQRAIAKILSDIDAKIELNRQMNQTLEQTGEALFKQWFIDFEFPNEDAKPYKSSGGKMVESELGMIPQDWEVKTIREVVEVKGGSTPSTGNTEYWENGQINWCTPKDLSNLSFPVLLETERKITDKGLAVISSGLLPKGTLLLSSRAPIGYLAISEIPVAINQGFIAINCNKGISNYYMLFWVKQNMAAIKSKAHGTTFEEINKASFRSINFVLPKRDILDKYDKIIQNLYLQLAENEKESLNLSKIRDSLLPKLMSGEIRVPT